MAANGALLRSGAAALLSTCLCLVLACAARAEDRIYWANQGSSDTIALAALDGSGTGFLDLGQAAIDQPSGLAIDPAAERIYWTNLGSNSLSFASLGGGGGGRFETGELTPSAPFGPAVDPIAERIYWADQGSGKIAFGDLDGSLSGNLATDTRFGPTGVVVDRAAGRLYWSSTSGAPVSFVNLDGSGGGDVNAAGATVSLPVGLAVDRAHGRVYWANFNSGRISYANLDGSGGGDLATGAATTRGPQGLAIDPMLGRIYWANSNGDRISYANLDGSGGGDLPVGGSPPVNPVFPVLLVAPRSVAPPILSGGSGVGSLLSCSQGEWAPDHLESFFYAAPQSFEFQWSRDGADVAGATESALIADASGAYACRVTARNRAGETTRTSAPLRVTPVAFGSRTLVTLRLATRRAGAKGPIAVRIANENPFAVTGRLSVDRRPPVAKRRAAKLAAKSFKVGAASAVVVRLDLPGSSRRVLAARGRLPLGLSAAVVDLIGQRRTVNKAVVVRSTDGR